MPYGARTRREIAKIIMNKILFTNHCLKCNQMTCYLHKGVCDRCVSSPLQEMEHGDSIGEYQTERPNKDVSGDETCDQTTI